ncbi:hypothetical protein [Burkholderia sp. Ac-20345]|uniref:hypothetical protein n=1 Tax=Burkholderia sp. Ac-20345 TaxID=2703891 RepID=UPI001F11CE4F|nr:hypothetical protein [Burkholderia sp. Ac-20345]
MPEAELFEGNWNHLFGPGRAETQCRIVVDVANDKLVAAQAFDGLKWVDLSAAEKAHLAESVLEVNEVSDDPEVWGLSPIGSLPHWAPGGESRELGSSPEDSIGMTDLEVVEGAERMARVLLKAWGFEFSGEAVRKSGNPRAISAWNVVSAMLKEYNGTDLSSAVDSVDCDVQAVSQPDPTPQALTSDPLQMLRNALRFNELGKRHESAEAISAAIGMLERK